MRHCWIVLVCGCRTILGIEDPIVVVPDDGDVPSDITIDLAAEGLPDGPSACPPGYATLANSGPRGHKYKLLATPATWTAQRDLCNGEMTFLAFPDGANAANAGLELDALTALAGLNSWVGVNDLVLEGSYRNALNQVVSQATLSLIAPGTQQQQNDCLVGAADTLVDENCTTNNRKAVCECVP